MILLEPEGEQRRLMANKMTDNCKGAIERSCSNLLLSVFGESWAWRLEQSWNLVIFRNMCILKTLEKSGDHVQIHMGSMVMCGINLLEFGQPPMLASHMQTQMNRLSQVGYCVSTTLKFLWRRERYLGVRTMADSEIISIIEGKDFNRLLVFYERDDSFGFRVL